MFRNRTESGELSLFCSFVIFTDNNKYVALLICNGNIVYYECLTNFKCINGDIWYMIIWFRNWLRIVPSNEWKMRNWVCYSRFPVVTLWRYTGRKIIINYRRVYSQILCRQDGCYVLNIYSYKYFFLIVFILLQEKHFIFIR